MTIPIAWCVLQIADSSFPTGGFAHSAGLEAALHLGETCGIDQLYAYIRALLWNAGSASLPFVAEAYDEPSAVWSLDARIDAQLTNHVANRASRTQGRALVATCARVFDSPLVASMAARCRTREVTSHLAPVLGASLAALSFERRDALALHLYVTLRGVTSAAVRLGIVGPYEAQRLLHRHAPLMNDVLEHCASLRSVDAATTAPLLDIFGATHDRLYARLFQS